VEDALVDVQTRERNAIHCLHWSMLLFARAASPIVGLIALHFDILNKDPGGSTPVISSLAAIATEHCVPV